MTSVSKVVTTSYLYDANDERIALGANGATTTYPFKLYNVQGNTIYKHIFANGEPVADVRGSTTTAKVYYIHDDHLGGSSVISDASANVAQVLEYYPFGGTRLDQRPDNTFNEQRRSDGHEFDTGTGLLYQDARYLGPTLGRFLSEDPALITPPTGHALDDMLSDPQKLNYYSYVQNNPLSYTDPDGKKAEVVYKTVSTTLLGTQFEIPGAHAFILISPNPGDSSLDIPGYEGQQKVTIGSYPDSDNPLNFGALRLYINHPSDIDTPTSDYLAKDPIQIPPGMSPDEYDRLPVRVAKSLKNGSGGILAQQYNPFGIPQVSGSANSNNGTTQIINSTGGSFIPRTFVGGRVAAGIGTPASSATAFGQLERILNAIQQLIVAFSAPTPQGGKSPK
jgi:RHS repeat-associated protein